MPHKPAPYPWHQHLIAVLVVLYIICSAIAYHEQLPSNLAVYFNEHGTPEGYVPQSMYYTCMLIFAGGLTALDSMLRNNWEHSTQRQKFCTPLLWIGALFALLAWWNYVVIHYNLGGSETTHFQWHLEMAGMLLPVAVLVNVWFEMMRLNAARPEDNYY